MDYMNSSLTTVIDNLRSVRIHFRFFVLGIRHVISTFEVVVVLVFGDSKRACMYVSMYICQPPFTAPGCCRFWSMALLVPCLFFRRVNTYHTKHLPPQSERDEVETGQKQLCGQSRGSEGARKPHASRPAGQTARECYRVIRGQPNTPPADISAGAISEVSHSTEIPRCGYLRCQNLRIFDGVAILTCPNRPKFHGVPFPLHGRVCPPRVPDLADAVPLRRQGAALVGGEKAEQNSLELQVLDFHTLVPATKTEHKNVGVYGPSAVRSCIYRMQQKKVKEKLINISCRRKTTKEPSSHVLSTVSSSLHRDR